MSHSAWLMEGKESKTTVLPYSRYRNGPSFLLAFQLSWIGLSVHWSIQMISCMSQSRRRQRRRMKRTATIQDVETKHTAIFMRL